VENLGEKRSFNKKLSGRTRTKYQRAAVKCTPIEPQTPFFYKIYRLNFVALSEKQFVSR
jgi:hypothetical protein